MEPIFVQIRKQHQSNEKLLCKTNILYLAMSLNANGVYKTFGTNIVTPTTRHVGSSEATIFLLADSIWGKWDPSI